MKVYIAKFLDSFKALHASCFEMLDENAKKEENEKWCHRRFAEIISILHNATKCISAVESRTFFGMTEAPSFVTQEMNEIANFGDVDTRLVKSMCLGFTNM